MERAFRDMNDHDLLISIAEKVSYISKALETHQAPCIAARAALREQINHLDDVKVNKSEFHPVRMITYGLVAIMLSGVLGVIVKHAFALVE